MRTNFLLTPESAAELFDKERARRARLAKGWSQRELAERLRITPAAVSQYENGHTRPSPDVLSRMASLLEFPLAYFTAGRRAIEDAESGWNFRSLAATTKRQRDRAGTLAAHVWEVAACLSAYVQLPELNVPRVPTTESSSNSVVVRAARVAREALEVPDGPVVDVVRTLEANGVVVARFTTELTTVDGFSRSLPEFPVVVLAADKDDKARSRFDAAHELGHLVMHEEFDGTHNVREQQAHLFASEFLMPAAEIRDSLPSRADFAELLRLKSIWGTSMAALLYRSRELDRMTDSTYRRAVTRMQRMGWRTAEPGNIGPPERPELLHAALELATARGMSLERLASETALPRAFLLEVLGRAESGGSAPAVSLAQPS